MLRPPKLGYACVDAVLVFRGTQRHSNCTNALSQRPLYWVPGCWQDFVFRVCFRPLVAQTRPRMPSRSAGQVLNCKLQPDQPRRPLLEPICDAKQNCGQTAFRYPALETLRPRVATYDSLKYRDEGVRLLGTGLPRVPRTAAPQCRRPQWGGHSRSLTPTSDDHQAAKNSHSARMEPSWSLRRHFA